MSSELIDTSKQDAARKKADRLRTRELGDIKKVLSCAEGRRLYWRILAHAGIYRINSAGNSQAFFAEGARAEGLYWLGELMSADHTAFASMQSENYSAAQSEQKQLQKET